MPSIKNTLLSLATITAVASTGSNFHVAADLTTTNAMFDGMAMFNLFMVGEIQTYVNDKKNGELSSQFTTAKAKIQNLADKGTLTPQQYTCIMEGFYTLANTIYPDFSGSVAEKLETARITTEKYISRAPQYWWDFYSDMLSTAATSVNNKELTRRYTAMDAKVEADIESNASAATIIGEYGAFLTSADALAPTYLNLVGEIWSNTTRSIVLDFKSKAVCSNSTTSVSAVLTPTSTLSPTADRDSSSAIRAFLMVVLIPKAANGDEEVGCRLVLIPKHRDKQLRRPGKWKI